VCPIFCIGSVFATVEFTTSPGWEESIKIMAITTKAGSQLIIFFTMVFYHLHRKFGI